MKKIITSLTIFFLFLSVTQVKAFHLIGGYISYKYLSPLTYKLTFTQFQDCTLGVTPSTSSVSICYSSLSCNSASTATLNLESFSYRPDNPCSPTVTNKCNGGFSIGLMEVVYSDTIVLPFACADWTFSWEACCAYASITNTNNGSGNGIYIVATLNNLNYGANSLPNYNQIIYNQYCNGNFTAVNISCTDVDGDSISYKLSPSHDASGGCPFSPVVLQYNPPYSFKYPLMSSTPEFMDSINGIFYFTPSQIEIQRFSFTVKEYRNGALLDSMTREDMLVISNYVPNPDTIAGKVFDDLNNNGIQNVGEQPIKHRLVGLDSLNIYTLTDSTGNYLFKLPLGSYKTLIPNLSPYLNCNPFVHNVTFTTAGIKSSNNNFGLYFIPGIKDLRISITNYSPAHPGAMALSQIDYSNVGTDTIFNPYIKFNADSNISTFFSNPVSDSSSINALYWNKPFLVPGQTGRIIIYNLIPSTLIAGTQINVSATIYPIATDTFPSDNTYNVSQPIVMSYDPNYKEVEPSGNVSTQFIADGSYLNYTIHFQNTGTAAAFYVDVKDTLDNNLDLSSFEFLSSSHNCIPQLNSYGYYKTIDFIFNAINLPDSSSNGPASHGFVKYRIKAKSNLQVGDSIKNAAQIFFDSNPPVPTNTVTTAIIAPNGIINLPNKNVELFVFPNPANNNVTIKLKLNKKENIQLALSDLMGKELYKFNAFSNSNLFEQQIDLSAFAKGIYIISAITDKEVLVQKIIKQ